MIATFGSIRGCNCGTFFSSYSRCTLNPSQLSNITLRYVIFWICDISQTVQSGPNTDPRGTPAETQYFSFYLRSSYVSQVARIIHHDQWPFDREPVFRLKIFFTSNMTTAEYSFDPQCQLSPSMTPTTMVKLLSSNHIASQTEFFQLPPAAICWNYFLQNFSHCRSYIGQYG